ncbi:hypothetical protein SprV_0100474100 [Sparganum proliferum]
MSLRLPLRRGGKLATAISVYATQMTSPDSARDRFYEDLHVLLVTVPKANKLIVLDDVNACVDTDCAAWRGALNTHSLGDNGLLLPCTCTEHRPIQANTYFHLPKREKTT